MRLALPALALTVEGQVIALHPGHIHFQQFTPDVVALLGRILGMRIHFMLEVVHHRAVRDEGQRTRKVLIEELIGILLKEVLRPRPCKEFHGHGVDLTAFQRRPLAFHGNDIARHITGKSVSRFVRHDLHIMLRTIEVGKNKGALIVRQGGAIAAARLAGLGFHIQQFVIQHQVDELRRFGRQFVVELSAVFQNFLRRALGRSVAAAVEQRFLIKGHGIGNAKAFRLLFADLLRHRHKILAHGRAELLHILLVIAVALHIQVSQRDVVVIAHLLGHRGAQCGELIVDLIQFCAVFGIPLAFGFPRAAALGVIGVLLEDAQLRQRIHAALKGDLCRGNELAVLHGQLALLLQLFHDRRIKALCGDLQVQERHFAVLFLKLLAEGAFQQRNIPLMAILVQNGTFLSAHLRFLFIEGIARIHVVADGSDGFHGLAVRGKGLHRHKRFVRFSKRGGVFQLFRLRGKRFFALLKVRANVLHLRKLDHSAFSSSVPPLPADFFFILAYPFLLFNFTPTGICIYFASIII